jgi:CO/xanthine dehydrogenase Mo-binding subunit
VLRSPHAHARIRSIDKAAALALADGAAVVFKAPKAADDITFPVQSSVVPWLRACARRHGIGIEPSTEQ